ncbi:cation diffusion facilitator family transporter [Sulfitobacter sp. F26169L]|uniref:cation diffusion facilitator family transporter n=1 Tax=Sulfitobacter sp. F26169L TaxID=2996015 RepID=UPI002260C5E5|nr:cation diffusion facilitator family transporter [Sulfitobacter sp. F26169L]MCX7567180.1 cation diffusion facilitator family transporter [Sulfitobacter sp. F26169L]
MGHDHSHHHHIDPEAGDAKVAFAVGLNLLLTVAQIIGGVLAGSLSLVADALHNLSDAMSLIIAFVARKIARRPADQEMTFGYGRIEAVAALVNYTTLIVIALYLVYEGVARFFEPSEVTGWIIVIIAGVALAVDLGTAALTYRMSKTSMNIRAAFLHNLADALGSVAVIVAGTLVILYGWHWVDPLVTLLIAGYILWHTAVEMPSVMRLLMLGAPADIDVNEVIDAMHDQTGVASVHHVHLWMMGEHENALQAHVVLTPEAQMPQTRNALHRMLKARFDLAHSTLQIEEDWSDCADSAQVVGHA